MDLNGTVNEIHQLKQIIDESHHSGHWRPNN